MAKAEFTIRPLIVNVCCRAYCKDIENGKSHQMPINNDRARTNNKNQNDPTKHYKNCKHCNLQLCKCMCRYGIT